jgi:hypothetical protein
LAGAVRLAVRTDLDDVAFSHHSRIDRVDGWQLGYRGSASWYETRVELADELAAFDQVLVVGNTRYLPWSPHCGKADVPHWILLEQRRGNEWFVVDHFAALLPQGEQLPFSGWLTDDELRAALTPFGELRPELMLRDVHALGTACALPPSTYYRWLAREQETADALAEGEWVTEPVAALRFLADRFASDSRALANHADDLWAASRHYQHRSASEAWSELPRSLRFAAESAARGRPRPTLVARAFASVIESLEEQ